MMIILRTHGESYNATCLDISPVSNDPQQKTQQAEKEFTNIVWDGPSKPYISNSLIFSANETRKNPKIRVFNIEN